MIWAAVGVAFVAVLAIALFSRRRKQKATVEALRTNFPPISRMRLVGSFPALKDVLRESDMRQLFEWILAELFARTGTPNYGELAKWTLDHGENETLALVAEVTRDAVKRLPEPVLQLIDANQGRTLAAVLLDQSLTEAGERTGQQGAESATDYLGRPE